METRIVKQNFLKLINSIKRDKIKYTLEFQHILGLHERSTTLFIALIVAILCLFPIPGWGTMLGMILFTLSFGFLYSYNIHIPTKIKELKFTQKLSMNILYVFFYLWHFADKYSKQRYLFLYNQNIKPIWFFIWVLMSIFIILPLPLGNIFPSITIIMITSAWILKDGLMLLLSLLPFLLAFIPFVLGYALIMEIIIPILK